FGVRAAPFRARTQRRDVDGQPDRPGRPGDAGPLMDLDEEFTEFRVEVRDWLATHVPRSLPSMDTAEGFAAHRAWERELAAARLSVVSWPVAYGGRDLPLLAWLVFEEEYHAAGAPGRVSQNGIFLLAPTLFEHGTPEQRDRLLPRMADATDVW